MAMLKLDTILIRLKSYLFLDGLVGLGVVGYEVVADGGVVPEVDPARFVDVHLADGHVVGVGGERYQEHGRLDRDVVEGISYSRTDSCSQTCHHSDCKVFRFQ